MNKICISGPDKFQYRSILKINSNYRHFILLKYEIKNKVDINFRTIGFQHIDLVFGNGTSSFTISLNFAELYGYEHPKTKLFNYLLNTICFKYEFPVCLVYRFGLYVCVCVYLTRLLVLQAYGNQLIWSVFGKQIWLVDPFGTLCGQTELISKLSTSNGSFTKWWEPSKEWNQIMAIIFFNRDAYQTDSSSVSYACIWFAMTQKLNFDSYLLIKLHFWRSLNLGIDRLCHAVRYIRLILQHIHIICDTPAKMNEGDNIAQSWDICVENVIITKIFDMGHKNPVFC